MEVYLDGIGGLDDVRITDQESGLALFMSGPIPDLIDRGNYFFLMHWRKQPDLENQAASIYRTRDRITISKGTLAGLPVEEIIKALKDRPYDFQEAGKQRVLQSGISDNNSASKRLLELSLTLAQVSNFSDET